MTGLALSVGTLKWYALSLAVLVLVTMALCILIWDARYVRNRKLVFAAAVNMLLAFGILYILSFYAILMRLHREVSGFWKHATDLPWIVYAVLEAVSFVILLLCIRESIRYRQNHLTRDVIRETVNMFPEGMAVSTGTRPSS